MILKIKGEGACGRRPIVISLPGLWGDSGTVLYETQVVLAEAAAWGS